MSRLSPVPPDSYTPGEIARAADIPSDVVREALGAGTGADVLIEHARAVALVRSLRAKAGLDSTQPSPAPVAVVVVPDTPAAAPALFAAQAHDARVIGMPAALSLAVHAGLFVIGLAVAGSAVDTSVIATTMERLEPLRMVYLALPGPGGGGGGGGTRQLLPASRAERKGPARVSSPVPAREPAPVVVPAPKPPEPKALPSEPLPQVVAPVVPVPGNREDRAGVLADARAEQESRGSGTGGGAGTGHGTGIGEGDGSGIGQGSGGGTGGGPYRPGSGVEPPVVLHEVRPTYTDEARARGLTGEVVLEVIVRRDGTVGAMRVLSGLGSGLDERAMAAVRQWRFAPARRLGTPVDVLVEVAVEFRLR